MLIGLKKGENKMEEVKIEKIVKLVKLTRAELINNHFLLIFKDNDDATLRIKTNKNDYEVGKTYKIVVKEIE